MNELTNNAVTMTSLEMVDFINGQRKEGEAELQHKHFLEKVPKVLGEETSAKFSADLPDSYGRPRKGYRFPKREACLMAMSYSYDLQAKVFDRMTELESEKPKDTFKLEPEPIKPSIPKSGIQASKEFKAFFSVAKLLGLDKNAAAISANQATIKTMGTNMLALLGHTHLEAANQESLVFTPSELGLRMGLSGQGFNLLLGKIGFQTKVGKDWIPTESARGYYRLFDTSKKHDSGTPIQQLKWLDSVLPLVKQAA